MAAEVAGSPVLDTGGEALLPPGFKLGHSQDPVGGTGCSVILCEQGAVGGVSVRGAAPATRETDLLDARNTVERIQAVVLSGGSAFGLSASTGVMTWLSEQGAGFHAGPLIVPLVTGASLFDLNVGAPSAYPDSDSGYAACQAAGTDITVGNVGAGTGATVGKILGNDFAMKAGFGAASTRLGELVITALVAVNALGNVIDRRSGKALAGVRDPLSPKTILDPYRAFLAMLETMGSTSAPTNTTIGCLLTNGVITKAQATHIADMVHDGYARAIEPVHTGMDGDAVFVLSTATVPTVPDLIGSLGALVMEAAIHDAVLSAQSAYGLPSALDLSEQKA